MKLIALILLSIWTNDPRDISKANQLKRMAEKSYQEQNYRDAAQYYSMLIDTMKLEDHRALLNMGHAYFKAGDTTYAAQAYQKLAMASDPKLQSLAYQQLGVINQKPRELPKALNYFKQAIKADPTNEEARYNYELVKKKLQQQKDQNQDDQQDDQKDKNDQQDKQDKQDQQKQDKQDQQNKDKQEGDKDEKQEDQNSENQQQDEKGDPKQDENKDQKDGKDDKSEQDKPQEQNDPKEGEQENEKKAPEPSTKEKLQEMNLNEETARMILEAMRNSEVQYLQQMKKKPSKAPDNKKPDW